MIDETKSCHGHRHGLQAVGHRDLSVPEKFAYHVRTKGFVTAVALFAAKVLRMMGLRKIRVQKTRPHVSVEKTTAPPEKEILDLQPGEWVEVKSEQEILAMLDQSGRFKGLLWMPAMAKFCGKRYRVFKRLNTILLEASMEFKKVKHTVILEGVQCDGEEFYGCDRSCYHYFREAWLRRVPNEEGSS